MLLAIDTATRTASIALYNETGVLGEATWRARQNHTTSLMPELVRLMRLSGAAAESLGAVAVTTGPGSFTGLRIGLSLAKGLALARGLPIIGLPTLDATAQGFAQQSLPICAVLEAGRGRFAAALYRPCQSHAERAGDYIIGTVEALSQSLGAQEFARIVVCGEVDANLRSTLLARLPGKVELANPAQNIRRAGFLAELAWQRWQTRELSDLDALTPYYIPTASLPQATRS